MTLHFSIQSKNYCKLYLHKYLHKLIDMTEDELQTRVIENIKNIRKQLGLSQEKLADKADISRQMMNDIEGRRRWLTKSTLIKLCNALEVDPHELFVPISKESLDMKNTYDEITRKVVSRVTSAVHEALGNLSC